jgi:hypothetical protein
MRASWKRSGSASNARRARASGFAGAGLGLLLAGILSAGAQEGHTDPAIERWIVGHAQKGKASEQRDSRRAVVGDLDGDGRSDVAVLYTIEGVSTDDYSLRYLAVFRRGADGLEYGAHRLVGGKGIREVNRATIIDRIVVLEALEYRPQDSLCCPSRPARSRYRLQKNRLVEIRSPNPAEAQDTDGGRTPPAM